MTEIVSSSITRSSSWTKCGVVCLSASHAENGDVWRHSPRVRMWRSSSCTVMESPPGVGGRWSRGARVGTSDSPRRDRLEGDVPDEPHLSIGDQEGLGDGGAVDAARGGEQGPAADAGGGEQRASADELVALVDAVDAHAGATDRRGLLVGLRREATEHAAAEGPDRSSGHDPFGRAADAEQEIDVAGRQE